MTVKRMSLVAVLPLVVACSSSPAGGSDAAADVDVVVDVTADVEDDAAAEDTAQDAVEPDTAPPADTAEPPALVWGSCDTATWWPAGYPKPGAAVKCTTVEVPRDYADPSGETLTLRVGRHRAAAETPKGAVFHLAGGPGGASLVQSGIIPSALPDLLDDYDQIYVDQRGTGGSGRLDCAKGYPETQAEWEACGREHRRTPLEAFGTVAAAHDVERVRQRLGYERVFLRGGSYGTRLGLEIVRQHPEHLVAVVLDGLAPPDVDLLGSDVTTFDHGVALLIADCAASEACTAVSPALEADLLARRAAVAADPPPIVVAGHTYSEDEELYLSVLQAALYTAQLRAKVPRAIHEAAQGDATRWYALMSTLVGATVTPGAASDPAPPYRPHLRRAVGQLADEYVAPGLFAAVMCSEWEPLCPGVDAMRATLDEQTWPDASIIDIVAACAVWNVDPVEPALHAAVTSAVPTLLVSGGADLNTYWEWGEHAAETLSAGTHVVIPWATHSTLSTPCGASLMSQFILAEGDIAEVDTSCVATVAEPTW